MDPGLTLRSIGGPHGRSLRARDPVSDSVHAWEWLGALGGLGGFAVVAEKVFVALRSWRTGAVKKAVDERHMGLLGDSITKLGQKLDELAHDNEAHNKSAAAFQARTDEAIETLKGRSERTEDAVLRLTERVSAAEVGPIRRRARA